MNSPREFRLTPEFARRACCTACHSMTKRPGVLALFDVDGTLTVPRKKIDDDMKSFMKDLTNYVTVGIVGEGPWSMQRGGCLP